MGNQIPNIGTGNVSAEAGSIEPTVIDRFSQSALFAADSFALVNDYVAAQQALLAGLILPEGTTATAGDVELSELDYSARPKMGELDLPNNWPNDNIRLSTFSLMPNITDATVPVMDITPPSWNNPDSPALSTITEPGDAPTMGAVDIPTAPSLTLPTAPNVSEIPIPAAPSITLPSFDYTLVDEVFNDPDSFAYTESTYVSDIWSDLLDKVLTDIQNGGTGLEAPVEEALINRALARQIVENDRLWREVETTFSAKGYSLPPGALAGALLEVSTEISRNNTEINEKVFIAQAELEQKNTHFMVTKGIELEGIVRNFFNAQSNRLLDVAKTVALTGIERYNALVARHGIKVEAYKAHAVVYEARIRGALADIEIFRAQIEGAKVDAEIQGLLVDIYEKQMRAVETEISLYTAQLEGSKINLELEISKIAGYKAETDAYVARIGAEKVKFEVYATQVEAEKTKVEMYAERVRAFLSEVEASKLQTSVEIARAEIVLKRNDQRIEKYKAEIQKYTASVDGAAAEIQSLVEGFKVEAATYSAETEATGMQYSAQVKEMDLQIQNARIVLDESIANVKAITDGYVSLSELRVKGTEGIITTGAQLAASALNSVNASASLGYSSSDQESESYSHGESLSESHEYNHSAT